MVHNPRLLDGLRQIANLLLSEETFTSCLSRIVHLCVLSIDASQAAGICVLNRNGLINTSATDDRVQAIDRFQYSAGSGPFQHAIEQGSIIRIDSMSEDPRWPEFAQRASRAGATASLTFPLIEDGGALGALTIYSYGQRRFNSDDERAGVMLAAQASRSLSGMRRLVELEEAATALSQVSSPRVSVATGVLMEKTHCSKEDAVEMLHHLAEMKETSIEVVALEVVAKARRNAPGGWITNR